MDIYDIDYKNYNDKTKKILKNIMKKQNLSEKQIKNTIKTLDFLKKQNELIEEYNKIKKYIDIETIKKLNIKEVYNTYNCYYVKLNDKDYFIDIIRRPLKGGKMLYYPVNDTKELLNILNIKEESF